MKKKGEDIHPWLRPLELSGGGVLPNGIIPGPMEGVSEGSFVDVMSKMGYVKSWFTPFIRVSSGVPRSGKLREKISLYLNTGLPVIAQIMGTHKDFLGETAWRLHALGAVCVDLNCACPSATVLGSKSGGYHLKHPGWITETLQAMRSGTGKPVSVKIRCGFQYAEELEEIAAALRSAAPSMVTCHFRTVKENYRPVERKEALRRLARVRELLPDIPLIGSGDLFTVEDALRMYEVCGVDGVAPARGLMKNPGLLREIEESCFGISANAEMTIPERLDFLKAIGDASGCRLKDQGFVLKIGKVMFGEDSQVFQELLEKFRKA